MGLSDHLCMTSLPLIVLSLSQVTVYFEPLAMVLVVGLTDPPEIVGLEQLAIEGVRRVYFKCMFCQRIVNTWP